MSTVIISDCNLAARRVDWEDTSKGLGLAKTVGAGLTITSNAIEMETPKAVKGLLRFALSAGSATFYLCRHAGTPDFSGTAQSNGDCVKVDVTDTNHLGIFHGLELDNTVAKPFFSVQVVDDSAGSTIYSGALYVQDLFPAGGGYHEATQGFNGLPVDNGANLAAYSDTLA